MLMHCSSTTSSISFCNVFLVSDCSCVHGSCANVISSRGECITGSCDEGWAGNNCNRSSIPCTSMSITCHQHAICREDGNGTER